MWEDVSLPIFIKFWDQKTSKDIKRNPATMTFRNHENSMQAEKSARHWNIIDQTCWNFGLLKKTCPIQYLATMTKKILSASRL